MEDDHIKCLALGSVVLFAIYIVYTYHDYHAKTLEGFQHKSVNYKSSLKQLEDHVKSLKKTLDVGSSRSEMEDVLTGLSEYMPLVQLQALMEYSNGKIDVESTTKTAEGLRALNDVTKAVEQSMKYLDSMKN